MKGKFALLLFVLAVFFAGASGEVQVSIEQVIDLTSSFVDKTVFYLVENKGTQPEESFLIATESEHLCEYSIQTDDERGTKDLTYEIVGKEIHSDIEFQIFKVSFPKALTKNQELNVKTHFLYSHQQTPAGPIKQTEQQQMVYQGNNYVATPGYSTKSQKTEIRASQIVGHKNSVDPSSITSNHQILDKGPYENVGAWEVSLFKVQYYNLSPFVLVDSLIKEIEVSHWGNVAVEENYKLHHGGAELDGGFSRLDYMKGAVGNSISEFVQYLPVGAFDVYYRDIIGNISSSNVFPHGNKGVKFQIRPRFVMFGGWKTEFKTGYNLSPDPYLKVNDEGRFSLSLPIVNEFEDAVIDEMEVRVILPEGATDIKVSPPKGINAFGQGESIRQTYMDTFGRPVFTFKAKSLISSHRALSLSVSYSFPSASIVREPLYLIVAYFLLFLGAMVYFRSDFRLHETELLSDEERALKKLIDNYTNLVQFRIEKYNNPSPKTFNSEITSNFSSCNSVIAQITSHDSELGKEAREIENLSKKRFNLHKEKVNLSNKGKTGAKKLSEVSANLESLEQEITSLLQSFGQ